MSKLTIDECKRIILQGRKQLTAAEQHIAKLEANNSLRWFNMFGTPERAARTLWNFSPLSCSYCALYNVCGDEDDKDCLLCNYDLLLEWLNQEVDA